MSTYTQIIYHIVFSTKERRGTLDLENHEELFRYVWGILKNKKCHVYQINGYSDHLHILTSLHPALALSNLVKDIKLASSQWIQKKKMFPAFSGWQNGYSAFTHSINEKSRIIRYIQGQKEHHKAYSFKEELADLLKRAGIEFDLEHLA